MPVCAGLAVVDYKRVFLTLLEANFLDCAIPGKVRVAVRRFNHRSVAKREYPSSFERIIPSEMEALKVNSCKDKASFSQGASPVLDVDSHRVAKRLRATLVR